MSKRRFLILIPVSVYVDRNVPALPGVRRDAERLRSVLQTHADGGVHRVDWLPDGKARKRAIVRTLRKVAQEAGVSDQVVIYFGGHGWRERDRAGTDWKYYLLTSEASFSSACDGLSLANLGDLLNGFHAGELVVILDCCFSGGMANFLWTPNNLDEALEGWKNHYVMAASRGREQAGEDDDGGFFVQALCDCLEGNGVAPDAQGRISAQAAWASAAAATTKRADRRGHSQSPVSSSPPTALIYLTRIDSGPSVAAAKGQLKDRFRERATLIKALRLQAIVRGDKQLANEIASVAEVQAIQPGENLISQGASDNDVYFILAGRLAIVVDGQKVAERTAGQQVGEMALIDPAAKRSATVTAIEETVLAKVTEPAFAKLADGNADLWRDLAIELTRRVATGKR